MHKNEYLFIQHAVKPLTSVEWYKALSKSILDQGVGMFRQFLAYKLKYNYGTELIEVNPQYTSQKYSGCGHIRADNHKNQASFRCVKSKLSMNADLNASLNIKAAGLAVRHECQPVE